MKLLFYFLFACLVVVLLLSNCTRTINDPRPRPATVSPDSREFFGVLVNGTGYVSEARTGNVFGRCVYSPTYTGRAGRSFQLFSDYRISNCTTITIGVVLDSIELEEGKKYMLGAPGLKKQYGIYSRTACSQGRNDLFTDDSTRPAYITITALDTVKHVVKGLFSFVVKDEFGKKHQISDGTFDRHYLY